MSLPHLKLISFTLCPFVQRAMIVLQEKNIPFEIEYIDLSAPPVWFYDISPLESVPVLLVNDQPLSESMVICDYLDEISEGSLYPDDPFVKAQHRAWIELGNEIYSTTYQFVHTDDEKNFRHLQNKLTDRIDVLEEVMEDNHYFAGEAFLMIDAIFAPTFRYIDITRRIKDYGFYDDAPRVKHWSENVLQRPSVINAVSGSYYDEMNQEISILDSVFSKQNG